MGGGGVGVWWGEWKGGRASVERDGVAGREGVVEGGGGLRYLHKLAFFYK